MREHALKYELPACSLNVFLFSFLSAVLSFSAPINLNITFQQLGKWICMRAITGFLTWKPRSGMMGEKRYALSSDIISCFRHSLTSYSFRRRKDYSLRSMLFFSNLNTENAFQFNFTSMRSQKRSKSCFIRGCSSTDPPPSNILNRKFISTSSTK